MSIPQSYLLTLFSSSTSDASSSLLSTIYGTGTTSTNASAQNSVQALQSAEKTETQQVKATAAQPAVKAAIAAFTTAVNSAKSVKQLLSNPAVMNVLLTANGMSDQIGYTALATQALTSNLSDPNSLANTLTDTRWQTLARTYNFQANGLKAIQSPTVIASVASAYATATWQNSQDSVTPGLSNALAFRSQASSITSVDQILGNQTLFDVATTALGIPQTIVYQPLEARQKAISERLNVADLQKPAFVESFVQKYLINNNASSSSSSSSSGTDLTSLAVSAQGLYA
jgi:hypothetical protein